MFGRVLNKPLKKEGTKSNSTFILASKKQALIRNI